MALPLVLKYEIRFGMSVSIPIPQIPLYEVKRLIKLTKQLRGITHDINAHRNVVE